MSTRLVDAATVAERLGVPKSWVLESARSGAMPCVRGALERRLLGTVEKFYRPGSASGALR